MSAGSEGLTGGMIPGKDQMHRRTLLANIRFLLSTVQPPYYTQYITNRMLSLRIDIPRL